MLHTLCGMFAIGFVTYWMIKLNMGKGVGIGFRVKTILLVIGSWLAFFFFQSLDAESLFPNTFTDIMEAIFK
jgi:hypothetical protein